MNIISNKLINENQIICMEDLNIHGMMKNHHLSKSIQEMNFGEFRRMMEYKCKWYGRTLVFVDRFYPSSKTCHNCGYVKNDLKLSDREWICPKCGTYHDRDVNAAVNILQEGERKIGGRTADFKPVENGPTCEVKSQTRAYSMKQEELQIE
jgi:putative transposase